MIGWIHADWDAPDHVLAGTTTREGGISEAGYASLNLGAHVDDEPASVAGNRSRLRHDLELNAEPCWLEQVHGNEVTRFDQSPAGAPVSDASVTAEPGVPLVIMTADCLPVLLVNRSGTEIAAVHGGWRSLAAGILARSVAAMASAPDTLVAWLGPAISSPNFEVGAEVREAFVSHDPDLSGCFRPNARGRYQADLYGIAGRQLRNLGVREISGGGWCTFAESERFYSHRRDPRCGRMASLLMLRHR
ncbi:MAG: peptidoglycan editing factor PgeF [Pseudomonadota bacterium]